jgi:hypothetical protein
LLGIHRMGYNIERSLAAVAGRPHSPREEGEDVGRCRRPF